MPSGRTSNAAHNQNPLTGATVWVDASTVVHASNPVENKPRAILCTADGTITMGDEDDTELALAATASTQPIPLIPTRITAVTGTFYLLY